MRNWSGLILVVGLGLLISRDIATGQSEIGQWSENDSELLSRIMARGEYLVFRTDTVLQPDSMPLHSDILFIGCNGAVDREIRGSVVALESELGLRAGAVIEGDVFLLRSQVFQSRLSRVSGRMVGASEAEPYRIVIEKLDKAPDRRVPSRLEMETNRMGGFGLEGYDRVDGFSLSWGFRLVNPENDGYPLFDGKVITATTRQALGIDTRVVIPLDEGRQNLIGLAARSRTDTHDRWRLGDLENAIKASTLGLDYRYYFRREGYNVYYQRNVTKHTHIRLGWGNERSYSLNNLSPFTFFGEENFVPNHPVSSQRIRSMSLETVIDTRNDQNITLNGFWISVLGELAGGKFGGAQSFARFDLELKRWNTFSGNHHSFIWAKFTGSDRPLPFQRGYTLGNTLRGYANFTWSGDRMLMAQASYNYEMPGLPLLNYLFFNFCPEIVYETGIAFFKGDPQLNYSDLRQDIGVGVSGRTLLGRVGVYVFRNLDGADINPKISITLDMNVSK